MTPISLDSGESKIKDRMKYFLEHKTLHEWLTIDGKLTNNPNDLSLIYYRDIWNAENLLLPIKEKWNSDYSGNYLFKDEGTDMMISVQNILIENCKKHGFDLYKDFTVTEHLFL